MVRRLINFPTHITHVSHIEYDQPLSILTLRKLQGEKGFTNSHPFHKKQFVILQDLRPTKIVLIFNDKFNLTEKQQRY